MEVILHKVFRKGLDQLPPRKKIRVDETLALFEENPFDPRLRNHPLHGRLAGLRAISAGGDLRLIFRVQGKYNRVEFVAVGSHNQVYG